jgi:phage terminase large subunit GpA-like protein
MNAPAATADGRALFFGTLAAGCRPVKRLTVSQWADKHRKLTSKASSEPGDWRTARVPPAKEIMDCLSVRSPVRSVTLMKAAQVFGTEIALNWIGYVIDHAPASMLIVVPTLDVRKKWVRQRLDPLLIETPVLAKKINAKKRRDGGNSLDMKDFAGGLLILGGANSAASLASMPIRYSINDELDRFPWEVGKGDRAEGDPHELIRARQTNFSRRKELNISTPTVKDASRIEQLFELGDQRYYHVPCPHCGEYQRLKFRDGEVRRLEWTAHPETKEVLDVWYNCEHNGCRIDEYHKTEMLEKGRWVPVHPDRKERSYHINSLYAPIGLGRTWKEIAQTWLRAQDDKTKLQNFINLVLGECWEDRTSDLPYQVIAQRAEPYQLREVPPGCLVLTAGVDVHPNRLEVQLLGHGRGGRKWVVDWLQLYGAPACEPDEGVWGELTRYLNTPVVNSFGRELRIEATALDTGGHNTHDVYNYVRARLIRRPMAIQGANKPGKPILTSRPKPMDVNWRGKVVKRGVMLWTVGPDTAKSTLFNRLHGDSEATPEERRIHFSNQLPEEYFRQLCAEAFDTAKNRWVLRRGRRNEGLDTFVYADAASQHPEIRVHAMKEHDWQRLEKFLEPAPTPPGEPVPALAPTPSGRRVISAGVGGFVNRWRK